MDLKEYLEQGYKTKHGDVDLSAVTEQELAAVVIRGDIYLQSNTFFILLDDFHSLVKEGNFVVAAHVSYLISYLIFVITTPPRSMEIALHFAEKAIELNESSEYREWLQYVLKGN